MSKPEESATKKLKDILMENLGSGSMDIIWGPDLELEYDNGEKTN
jgi:hypothetical protein